MKKITLSKIVSLIFFILLPITANAQWYEDPLTDDINNTNTGDVLIYTTLKWSSGSSFLSNDQFGSIELGSPYQRCTPYIDFRSKEVPFNEDFNARIINSADNQLDFITSSGSNLTLNGNPNPPYNIPSLKLSNSGYIGNSLQFQTAFGTSAIDFWNDGGSGIMDFYADYQNNPTYAQFTIKSVGACGWGNDWNALSNDEGGSIHLNKYGENNNAKPYIDFSHGWGNNSNIDMRIVSSAENTLDFLYDLQWPGTGGTKIMSVKDDGVYAKKLTVQTSWSDFVFKPEYKLKPLAEVEKYIIENGHLEGIPNEKEVSENGVDVGDMTSKLLLKIEELSLYVIDINKQLETLKKENEEMKTLLNK